MEKLFSIKAESKRILKDIGLKNVSLEWNYNSRLSRVVARVSYEDGIENPKLTVGDIFLKQCDEIKIKVLKHEIAHVYDRNVNKRRSKHDKIFKDLCEKLYGDRVIGQATVKHWENWIR